MKEFFKENKKVAFILILVIVILLLNFVFIGFIYFIDVLGRTLLIGAFRFIPVDPSKTSSIYEYLSLYSQFLNVLVMGILTFGLFLFAYRDYIYNHIADVSIKMVVSHQVKIAVNKYTTKFHIPLAFQNNSKKAGIINDVILVFEADGQEHKFYTENTTTVHISKEKGHTLFDTLDDEPFSATPIKGEDAIRKIVTFGMSENLHIQYEPSKAYKMTFYFEKQKEVFYLSFTNDEFYQIFKFKEEDRSKII